MRQKHSDLFAHAVVCVFSVTSVICTCIYRQLSLYTDTRYNDKIRPSFIKVASRCMVCLDLLSQTMYILCQCNFSFKQNFYIHYTIVAGYYGIPSGVCPSVLRFRITPPVVFIG